MTAFAPGQDESYGALELKRNYQFGLILALLGAVALHLAAIGGARLYGHLTYMEPLPSVIDCPIPGPVIMRPPPNIIPDDPRPAIDADAVKPDFGIPVPRPDELVPGDHHIATQTEKRLLLSGVRGGTGTGRTPGPDVGGICDGLIAQLPPPEAFIPVEQDPVAIKRVIPAYPPLAEATGMSGEVLVRALVDEKGMVRDVVIARASGSDLGFEEAALEAIRQWLFRPATNNDQPVAVWINIPIVFELE